MSGNSSNFTSVFVKSVCNAYPGVVRKRPGSSSYISGHISKIYRYIDWQQSIASNR